MGASIRTAEGAAGAPAQEDHRWLLFQTRVTEPWKRLVERAAAAKAMHEASEAENGEMPRLVLESSIRAVREHVQTVSWYIVADLLELLHEHLPEVARAVLGQVSPALKPFGADLAAAIDRIRLDPSLKSQLQQRAKTAEGESPKVAESLAEALRAMAGLVPSLEARSAESLRADLERVDVAYTHESPDPGWPAFLFPLADCEKVGPMPPQPTGGGEDDVEALFGHFLEVIKSALAETKVQSSPAAPIAASAGIDMREGWFVLRCVFERPECAPRHTAVVSAPTVPFQMAGFFDPDAPARPIRIGLPVDTTPAGLRKFDKNTAFMVSDVLCRQLKRFKGITLGDLVRSVLPWPLHKDLPADGNAPCSKEGPNPGMMCSLSIPIITICALVLLMIIVSVLDFVFRWLPFFSVCFPLRGFGAKKES